VQIDDAREGFLLKLRYPSGMSFVDNSAKLTVHRNVIRMLPLTEISLDESSYLTFHIQTEFLGDRSHAMFELVLLGDYAVHNGQVGVDADRVDEEYSFDAGAPRFTARDAAYVEVVD
jgi:hypothetical protein